ncbi:hypothetical protein H6P81_013780 [Aristolochia fimbriata]|uniref:Histone acetyltransferase n=1 Tax=Aristolochia fimbriata TaxID=158543 RepID=A0AAV7EFP0_ARIFI|nr:hypothetical protein H6P81_013780 [Aristolochia fimbriata]
MKMAGKKVKGERSFSEYDSMKQLFCEEIISLGDDAFEGSCEERQIFMDVFYGTGKGSLVKEKYVADAMDSVAEDGFSSLFRPLVSEKSAVTLLSQTSVKQLFRKDASILSEKFAPSDPTVKEKSGTTVPSHIHNNYTSCIGQSVSEENSKLVEIPLDVTWNQEKGPIHSVPDITDVIVQVEPMEVDISGVTPADLDARREKRTCHVVESFSQGILSREVLLGQCTMWNAPNGANDIKVLEDEKKGSTCNVKEMAEYEDKISLIIEEGHHQSFKGSKTDTVGRKVKEVGRYDSVKEIVSQEMSPSELLSGDGGTSLQVNQGPIVLAKERTHVSVLLKSESVRTSLKKTLVRDLRLRLREQINQIFISAGWTIEIRKRRSRTYLEPFYKSPGGKATELFHKAWRSCGESVYACGLHSSLQVTEREWVDINEFWCDLSDALEYIEKEIHQSETSLPVAHRWTIIHPFVHVIYIGRKIGELRAGKLVQVTNDISTNNYQSLGMVSTVKHIDVTGNPNISETVDKSSDICLNADGIYMIPSASERVEMVQNEDERFYNQQYNKGGATSSGLPNGPCDLFKNRSKFQITKPLRLSKGVLHRRSIRSLARRLGDGLPEAIYPCSTVPKSMVDHMLKSKTKCCLPKNIIHSSNDSLVPSDCLVHYCPALDCGLMPGRNVVVDVPVNCLEEDKYALPYSTTGNSGKSTHEVEKQTHESLVSLGYKRPYEKLITTQKAIQEEDKLLSSAMGPENRQRLVHVEVVARSASGTLEFETDGMSTGSPTKVRFTGDPVLHSDLKEGNSMMLLEYQLSKDITTKPFMGLPDHHENLHNNMKYRSNNEVVLVCENSIGGTNKMESQGSEVIGTQDAEALSSILDKRGPINQDQVILCDVKNSIHSKQPWLWEKDVDPKGFHQYGSDQEELSNVTFESKKCLDVIHGSAVQGSVNRDVLCTIMDGEKDTVHLEQVKPPDMELDPEVRQHSECTQNVLCTVAFNAVECSLVDLPRTKPRRLSRKVRQKSKRISEIKATKLQREVETNTSVELHKIEIQKIKSTRSKVAQEGSSLRIMQKSSAGITQEKIREELPHVSSLEVQPVKHSTLKSPSMFKKFQDKDMELGELGQCSTRSKSRQCAVNHQASRNNVNSKRSKPLDPNFLADSKAFGTHKRSRICNFDDDDLLVAAIVRNNEFDSNSKRLRKKRGSLDTSRKLRNLKQGCKLMLRSPLRGGKLRVNEKRSRTVLSWLIDCGAISVNDIIQYRSPKNGSVVKDGWVTKDGVLCRCCNKILSISEFKFHAGFKMQRPCLNIFLESGKLFTLCQFQAWSAEYKARKGGSRTQPQAAVVEEVDQNDDTCGLCGDGGELLCCDNCPSTFHQACLSAQELPEGNWYCPNCTCQICGNEINAKESSNSSTILKCSQCEHKYHGVCMNGELMQKEVASDAWFCGDNCLQVYSGLHSHIGIVNHIADGFGWTVLRCIQGDQKVHSARKLAQMAECNTKLAVALTIMEECFLPMLDPRTGIDMIPHILYNRGSDFARLNYQGFFTIVLEKADKLISVASIRVHGVTVAEMPLIATCSEHRRQGMCRLLLNAIEEMMRSLKVKLLVISAIPSLVDTWVSGFGFRPMEDKERQRLENVNLIMFPGTVLLLKQLKTAAGNSKTIHEDGFRLPGEQRTVHQSEPESACSLFNYPEVESVSLGDDDSETRSLLESSQQVGGRIGHNAQTSVLLMQKEANICNQRIFHNLEPILVHQKDKKVSPAELFSVASVFNQDCVPDTEFSIVDKNQLVFREEVCANENNASSTVVSSSASFSSVSSKEQCTHSNTVSNANFSVGEFNLNKKYGICGGSLHPEGKIDSCVSAGLVNRDKDSQSPTCDLSELNFGHNMHGVTRIASSNLLSDTCNGQEKSVLVDTGKVVSQPLQ